MVQITSASEEDGKTTIAANLAVVLAQAGRTVALVDAQLRRPRIHHMFDAVDGLAGGFTSAVLGRTELVDAVRELDLGNGRLWVCPSGPLPPGPAELLGSKQADRFFKLLRDSVDIVIGDSPAVLPVADARVLSFLAFARSAPCGPRRLAASSGAYARGHRRGPGTRLACPRERRRVQA